MKTTISRSQLNHFFGFNITKYISCSNGFHILIRHDPMIFFLIRKTDKIKINNF